jgi:LysR family nitrogen assimilation transcriptional regulator
MRPIVADFDAAINDIGHVAPAQAPRVRVGLMPSVDDESITTESFVCALEKWQLTHGEGHLQVMEAFSEELLQWLQLRKIDFAIIDRKFADPLLRIEPVIEDSMAVVTDPRHGLLEPGPVELRQLVTLPLVLPSQRHGLRGLISRHLADNGINLEPKVEVDSMAAALRLVATGRYATILPLGAILKSSVRRHLAVHEIREPRIARHICLARSRREPCSQPVLDLMREVHLAFVRSAAALS